MLYNEEYLDLIKTCFVWALYIFILTFNFIDSAQAAKFTILDQKSPDINSFNFSYFAFRGDRQSICHLKMSGEIEEGDFEKFISAMKKLPQIEAKGICLDSQGGSYDEAIKIAKALLGKYDPIKNQFLDYSDEFYLDLWTVIDKGDQCLSACAIIFMAGNIFVAEEAMGPSISRHLHLNGKLGFHSPFLDITGDTPIPLSLDEIRNLYKEAVLAVAELPKLSHRLSEGGSLENNNLFPSNLLLEMLKRDSDQFYYIDRIYEALQYDIELFGGKLPKKLTANSLRNICDNIHNTDYYRDFSTTTETSNSVGTTNWSDWSLVKQKRLNYRLSKGEKVFTRKSYGAEGLYNCVVRLKTGKVEYLNDLIDLDFEKIEDYLFTPVPWYYHYDNFKELSKIR